MVARLAYPSYQPFSCRRLGVNPSPPFLTAASLRERLNYKRQQRQMDDAITFNGAVYRPMDQYYPEDDWKRTAVTDSPTVDILYVY